MRIVIVGSGTGIPVPERGYAAVYAQVGSEHWLFDAGPGTLQRLSRLGITYRDLDRLFLTHYHPDHCLDCVSILFAMHIQDPEAARTKPFTIYGPPGLQALIHGMSACYPGMLEPRTYTLTLETLSPPATLTLPPARVNAQPMPHGIAAVGYRIEAPEGSFAYSGDTGFGPEAIALGRDTDLLILECSLPEPRKVATHLTPADCGRIAAAAQPRHLALTHFYPLFANVDLVAEVARHFPGRLTVARDGEIFLVPERKTP